MIQVVPGSLPGYGHGAGGEVGKVVEAFEGEVELLPGRLSADVELNQLDGSVWPQLSDYGEAGDDNCPPR